MAAVARGAGGRERDGLLSLKKRRRGFERPLDNFFGATLSLSLSLPSLPLSPSPFHMSSAAACAVASSSPQLLLMSICISANGVWLCGGWLGWLGTGGWGDVRPSPPPCHRHRVKRLYELRSLGRERLMRRRCHVGRKEESFSSPLYSFSFHF